MLAKDPKLAAILFGTLALTSCARELGDDRLTIWWAVLPLLLYAGCGGFWLVWHRRRELERWDLRRSPLPPDGGHALWGLELAAGAVGLIFIVLVLLAEGVAFRQRWTNLALWVLFSGVAVAIAAVVGRRWAERGFSRGDR